MAMNHGSMLSFQLTLGNRDCDPAIGELVLSGEVARLFAPCSRDCHFVYEATLVLYDGCPAAVRVFKAAAGRETVLREGWNAISTDFNLLPGNIAVFTRTSHHGTFTANFLNGFNRAGLQRRGIPYQPLPPVQVNPDWLRAQVQALASAQAGRDVQAAGAAAAGGVQAAGAGVQAAGAFVQAAGAAAGGGVQAAGAAAAGGVQAAGAFVQAAGAAGGAGVQAAGAAGGGGMQAALAAIQAGRGVQAAGAAAGGSRALQGDDMAIRQAMDLAVECGAEEGSDEHYIATKLFVKADNRAIFLSFKSNKKRLRWLSRCYTDGWTG